MEIPKLRGLRCSQIENVVLPPGCRPNGSEAEPGFFTITIMLQSGVNGAMISIDFDSDQIFIGQISVPVKLTDNQGCLHLNYPDGPILRPLSVLERLRLIQYALTANNTPAALAASILHAATVKPGVGDYRLYEAVAVYLAGGGLKAPPIYQSISMVARHTGWHPNDIFSAEAAQIDRMASALGPASSSEWTRVLMLDAGQDELDAYANDLAASLIGRMDDGESGDLSYAGQNQDIDYVSNEAQSPPGSTNGLQSSDKKVLTDGSVFQEQISPRSIQTGSDQPFTFDRAGEHSSSSEPPDKKSRLETSPAEMNQIGESPSTISDTRSKGETSNEMNTRYSPNDGFTLKKLKGHRQNNEQTRPPTSIRSNATPAGMVEPVIYFSRPEAIKVAGMTDPSHNGTPFAAGGENREHGLTPQPNLDRTGNYGTGFDSTSTGARPELRTVPDIAADPPAAERPPPDRLRLSQRTADAGTHDWPKVSHHSQAARFADDLDHDIAAFFGHRKASVAEGLADSLNREADLRGID